MDVDSTLESGQPEMVARVNREMAADLGFDVGSVAMQLRGMVEGVVPTRLRDGDKEYDIRVRLAPEFRNDFQAIARAPMYSPRGALVRTSDIATMEPGIGPTNINREQRRRQAKIGVELSDRPLGDVTTDVAAAMATVQMPPNFEWGFAGDVEMMQESAAAMGLAHDPRRSPSSTSCWRRSSNRSASRSSSCCRCRSPSSARCSRFC